MSYAPEYYSGDSAGIIAGVIAGLTSPIVVAQPVSTSGQLTDVIVIGDDYLAANGRAFEWTIPAIAGATVGGSQCFFGFSRTGLGSVSVEGTITDAGNGNWLLSHDLPKSDTVGIPAGNYDWSVQVVTDGAKEITRVRSSDECGRVRLVEKQT